MLKTLTAPLLILRNLVAVQVHARRRKDHRAAPNPIAETLSGLAMTNIYPFFVDMRGEWDYPKITKLLSGYGIKTFGDYTLGHDLVFYVRIGQSNFAQHLMKKSGVPLKRRILIERVGKRRRITPKRRRATTQRQPTSKRRINRFGDWLDS